MEEKKKGIGLIGLIGMVISSCIGSGVFAITGQLAGVASPGAVLIAWLIVGVGFLALAFSLNNLTEKRSDLHGIFSTLMPVGVRSPASSPAGATGCRRGSAMWPSPR